jgi:hypothetical protein
MGRLQRIPACASDVHRALASRRLECGALDPLERGLRGSHRCGDPEISALRHRPADQPHPGLRAAHCAAREHLRRRGPGPGPGVRRDRRRAAELGGGRRPPWPWPPCSSRPAAASKESWIGASTAASTTRPRPSRPSARACVSRSTWTRCRPSCWRWSTRRCSRPRLPYGCGHRREHRRAAEGKQLRHPIRRERLHAMPFRSRPSPHVRDGRPAYRPPWSDRDCLLITARARCLWHAGGTASENDVARTCRRRLPARGSGQARPGDDGLVGKLRSGAAASGRLRSRSVDPPAPLGGLTQR